MPPLKPLPLLVSGVLLLVSFHIDASLRCFLSFSYFVLPSFSVSDVDESAIILFIVCHPFHRLSSQLTILKSFFAIYSFRLEELEEGSCLSHTVFCKSSSICENGRLYIT